MVAAAVIGAGVLGAGATAYSADRSRSAANTQANAANQASGVSMDMFNRMQGNMLPFMNAGKLSLGALSNFMGINPDGTTNPNAPGMHRFSLADLPNDPGYQFRLQQGEDAIMNQKSAMGGVFSGPTLKALTGFAQGTASDEFNNAWKRYNFDTSSQFDRLFNITGMGENASAGVGTAGLNTAATIGANTIGAGNAIAAGQVGSANAITSGTSNIYNQWLMSQIFGPQGGGGTGWATIGSPGSASELALLNQ